MASSYWKIWTHCVIFPSIYVSIHIQHRGDIEVHVLEHLLQFGICFVVLENLSLETESETEGIRLN